MPAGRPLEDLVGEAEALEGAGGVGVVGRAVGVADAGAVEVGAADVGGGGVGGSAEDEVEVVLGENFCES